MKPWTKREVSMARSAILSCWLEHRPTFPNYLDGHASLTGRFRAKLESVGRKAAALYGLTKLRSIWACYERRANETAVHYLSHFGDEATHRQFLEHAKEYAKKRETYEKVMAKIEELGLPSELAEYDPCAEAPAG